MTTATKTTSRNAAVIELDLGELDVMSGASIREVDEDEKALRAAGYLNEELGSPYFHWKTTSAKIDEAWARAGVHCYTRPSDSNTYVIDGESVLHTTALRHLLNYPAQK